MSVIERVDGLEQRTRELEARLAALEGRRPAEVAPERPARSFAPPVVALPSTPTPPERRDPPSATSLEDLLGGRVLAWAGGVTLFAGLLFLLVIAVSRGWVGQEARTALAAATSLALLAVGMRTYERRGRTDSALAATAAGIAGLFASVIVAAQVYELIPALAGLAIAFAVAATATYLAIRWEAPGIAALGILGAVLSPALVGAEPSLVLVGFLFAATASAVGVLVWQRWTWLAFATFGVATLQWVAWIVFQQPGAAAALVVLLGFGALAVAAAVGFELRTRSDRLSVSSHVLLVLNALVLAWAGWVALSEAAGDTAGHVWLGGLALAHLAFAVGGQRLARVSHELVLASAALGIVLADVAFASAVDGLPLVAGWAVSGVAMAALARAARTRLDGGFALTGLGAHLGLSLAHVLVYEAPVGGGGHSLAAATALVLVAAGCFVSARIARGAGPARVLLDGAGIAVVAYLASVMLDGPALTLAWTAQAAGLAELARRHRDTDARDGALALLGCAAVHALVVLAPVDALVSGVADPVGALALLAVAGAALVASRIPGVPRLALQGLAAVTVLYLASVEIITVFQPSTGGVSLGELGVRQQGQALLSGVWALVGVAALVAGLLRDRRELRLGALALLTVTLAKVGLYDLASLDSMYRVASFVALGALLLLGAFAWQRLRPTAPRDLREVPPAIR
ncbi:MAG: hypothetical protein QOC68_3387 [Solirubrobacteraceae bacterium]|nr:hypothetical protein [Solirubrobacteraceae bacterium]